MSLLGNEYEDYQSEFTGPMYKDPKFGSEVVTCIYHRDNQGI